MRVQEPIPGVAEQINLQLAANDVVVASFVTFGDLPAGSKPVARLSLHRDMKEAEHVLGVTHDYISPSSDGAPQIARPYKMHFCALKTPKERTTYFYQVASHAEGNFSAVMSFKSLYSSDTQVPTRFAVFGDMGLFDYGNTVHGSLQRDMQAGTIDFFAHMGDHAYQMSSADDHRGDGYMNAYQPLASQLPWIPVIGNHEYYDNAYFHRFLNQSFGVQLRTGPQPAGFCQHDSGCATGEEIAGRHPTLEGLETITADSALGTFMARSTVVAGTHSKATVPSHTSRWFSVDVGLVHFVMLDLMVYPMSNPKDCVDPSCPGVFKRAQKKWLKEDLKSVDRSRTPWM